MTDYYVSTIGNDSNTGLSEAQAWRTIGNAAKRLSVVSAGDIVHVLVGTYNEDVTISKSGTADHRIVFMGENYPTVDTTSTGFRINGDYVTVTGFSIKNANYGIWAYGNGNGTNHVIISNNIMDDFSVNGGILIWSNSTYTTIDNNTINADGLAAIEIDGSIWYMDITNNRLNTLNTGIGSIYFWGAGDGKNYLNVVGNTIKGGRNAFGGGPRSYGYIANNYISGHFHNGMNHHSMTYTLVENNVIGDSIGGDTQHAIYIDGSTKTWHDNVFRNNHVEAASHGCCLNINNAENALVEGLTCGYCSGAGILIISDDTYGTATPSGNFTFKNVSFTTGAYYAIRWDAVGSTVLSNNYYFINIEIKGSNILSGWVYDDPGTRPTTYIINTNLPTTRWVSNATGGEFRFYYPLDVKVIDINGNPISGATVTITNNIDSNYPSINYKFENKTSFITGTNGHTSLPSDEENSIAIMDFRKTSTTTDYMTYTITAERLGYTNSTTVKPDSSWYRSDPNILQNTITIQLPVEIIGGAVAGKITDISGNPIENVNVDVDGTIVLTDIDGNYELASLLPDTYNMSISKVGYISKTDQFIITTSEYITKNFTLSLETGCPIPICEFTLIQL